MQHDHTMRMRPVHRRHAPRPLLSRLAGWALIGLGLLGIVLPVLPGLIFIALGIITLGPHDPTLRRVAVAIRIVLRRWSQSKQRHLRAIGSIARSWHRATRLALREQLHQHERGERGWRAHARLLAILLIGLSISAGIMLFVWRTIL